MILLTNKTLFIFIYLFLIQHADALIANQVELDVLAVDDVHHIAERLASVPHKVADRKRLLFGIQHDRCAGNRLVLRHGVAEGHVYDPECRAVGDGVESVWGECQCLVRLHSEGKILLLSSSTKPRYGREC